MREILRTKIVHLVPKLVHVYSWGTSVNTTELGIAWISRVCLLETQGKLPRDVSGIANVKASAQVEPRKIATRSLLRNRIQLARDQPVETCIRYGQ